MTTTPQTEWERLVPPSGFLAIVGCGNLCRQLLEHFPDGIPGHPIVAFMDNDPAKDGVAVGYNGHVIRAPHRAGWINDYTTYVILVHLGAESVHQQLIGLGVPPDRIVHWWTLWQHFSELKLPAWADVPPYPDNWLDAWSDEASRQVVWDAYDFFKTYSDRTAVYKPRTAYSLPENIYFDETVYQRFCDESLLDCGAFNGDTIRSFFGSVDWQEDEEEAQALENHFIAVEPSPENFCVLSSGWADHASCVELVNAALVGDPSIETIQFRGHGVSACIGDGVEVPATTIDKLCERYDFHPTLIKLDIEGAELDALRGAVETIKRDRPVIACCLYHRPSDLWTIPAFLAGVCEDYVFLARGYDDTGFETVMYAVPAERAVS